jgi:hypothetical protein
VEIKSWMTAALMEEWLKGFNERMRQQVMQHAIVI